MAGALTPGMFIPQHDMVGWTNSATLRRLSLSKTGIHCSRGPSYGPPRRYSTKMPGLVIDTTAERTPALSICSRARRGDQHRL